MPKKTIASFSAQYKQLIEEAEFAGEWFIRVEGGTPTEIRNKKITLRSQLYTFLAVIRHEAEGPKPNPWAVLHREFAAQTGVKIVEDGVMLYPKKSGTISQLIEMSLQAGAQKRLETKPIDDKEANAVMARIMERHAQREAERNRIPKTQEEINEEINGGLYRATRLINENGDPINPKDEE